jgi:hypothetical protein
VVLAQSANEEEIVEESFEVFLFDVCGGLLELADLLLVVRAALGGGAGGHEAGHVDVDLGGLLLASQFWELEDEEKVVVEVLDRAPVLDLTALLHLIH